MAELEALQEAKQENPGLGPTDLLMAIPAPLGSNLLAPGVQKISQAMKLLSFPYQVVLALPGEHSQDEPAPLDLNGDQPPDQPALRYVNYPLPAAVPGIIPWLPDMATYREIARLASALQAQACTVLGTDTGFSRDSLTPERLTLLVDPAIGGSFDLVMPLYASQAFDDLVNKSILYPLTRSLYGHRVQNPLGTEFQISSRMFPVIAANTVRDANQQQVRFPWLATLAAGKNLKICQAQLGARRPSSAEGIELSDALAQLTGPLFLDMEDNAALWQRIRGSHDAPIFGSAASSTESTDTVDVRHMVETFQLGERNLRDFWALILPPVTLLELKKLSRLAPDDFRMPDALWARIVYDFALAHRLRNIHRTHLFGALTPLYLGWVASYAVEINRSGIAAAQQRVEQLARTYESEKPYLLSRWRWPDRFHP
jgi:glucosylglycerate synthase